MFESKELAESYGDDSGASRVCLQAILYTFKVSMLFLPNLIKTHPKAGENPRFSVAPSTQKSILVLLMLESKGDHHPFGCI